MTPTDDATCTRDELRTLFLFEALTDAQLDRLHSHGHVEYIEPGPLFTEGTPAAHLYVLFDGEVALSKRSGAADIETVRTAQRGSYFGSWSAFLEGDQAYETSARILVPSRMFVLEATTMGEFMRSEFPMACHFLSGHMLGRFHQSRIVGPHDRLLQLGQLTAGLTHELNNPAAAALRATSALRTRVASVRHRMGSLAGGTINQATMRALVGIADEVAEAAAKAEDLAPLEKSDREEQIGDWLEDHDIDGAWDVAPTFAEAGLDTDWLERIAATLQETDGTASLDGVVHWLSCTIETELLVNEITHCTSRVANLVGRAAHYAHLDRAPFNVADVHELIRNTVMMQSHTIGSDVMVVEEFDGSVPTFLCYPAELGQVWTNLIVNAVQAMRSAPAGGGCSGTLTLRTRNRGDVVRVEVCDTGPGVPEELRERIFDPFFTTKPIGEGTGLGLDFASRIVHKHGGTMWVESTPGDTRFICILPLRNSARDGAAGVTT